MHDDADFALVRLKDVPQMLADRADFQTAHKYRHTAKQRLLSQNYSTTPLLVGEDNFYTYRVTSHTGDSGSAMSNCVIAAYFHDDDAWLLLAEPNEGFQGQARTAVKRHMEVVRAALEGEPRKAVLDEKDFDFFVFHFDSIADSIEGMDTDSAEDMAELCRLAGLVANCL